MKEVTLLDDCLTAGTQLNLAYGAKLSGASICVIVLFLL